MSKDVFVFVVCGSQEHLDTLHFSLRYLNKYSKKEVWVLTDSSRNEIPINHHTVIDVKTPDHFNHHQASVYLKTGIHKFLPKGNQYCYLDTDVVAVSPLCDEIFDEFIAPIRFAPDHCQVRKFSSYAVNCGCLQNREVDRKKFTDFVTAVQGSTIKDETLKAKAKELQHHFDLLKPNIIKKAFTAFRYFTSYPIFRLNREFYFNKKTRTWHDSTHAVIMYEMDITRMQKETGLTYNKWTQRWLNANGEDIWYDECNHLTDFIKTTFNIEIKDKNWQHWNGGVFVFTDASHDFLDAWHNKTMHIFTLPNWKTRDQGTLIATAWEFNLANHHTLSKQFNFIADYNNNGVQINTQTNQLTDDGFVTSYNPAFVHVYHHWMDKTWPIWQWVETK
ncbi:MAG: hypothetical protein ACK44D_01925 [Bacteroidia bacterium]